MRLPALLIVAVLAGPTGAGPAAELPRFDDAWTRTRGDGIAVAVVALGSELGDHVAAVVASDAPGASVTAVPVAAEGDVDEVVASATADVVVLALGEASLGDRLLANEALAVAIAAATASGAVVVAGAGSEAETRGPAPVVADAVVVGGVTAVGQPRPYANRSLLRTLGAPVSGAPGDDPLAGTSVAAGHVGAAVALLLAQGRAPGDISDLLAATAANPFGDARLGAGYLDAAAAVAAPIPGGGEPVRLAPGAAAPAAVEPVLEPADQRAPEPVPEPRSRPFALAGLVAVAAVLLDVALGREAWRRRRGRP